MSEWIAPKIPARNGLSCMEHRVYLLKSYFSGGFFPFQGIEGWRLHSPGSTSPLLVWPVGRLWPNLSPKGKSRVCVAQHSSFHVILGVALHWLSDQAAPPELTATNPGGSSKSHPEPFYFYFTSITARHQGKIKVNYCVLWVSETSFCFLPRSCSAPWVGAAGSAPIPSPSHSHSHRCSSQHPTERVSRCVSKGKWLTPAIYRKKFFLFKETDEWGKKMAAVKIGCAFFPGMF